jgi:hypothetical protein
MYFDTNNKQNAVHIIPRSNAKPKQSQTMIPRTKAYLQSVYRPSSA